MRRVRLLSKSMWLVGLCGIIAGGALAYGTVAYRNWHTNQELDGTYRPLMRLVNLDGRAAPDFVLQDQKGVSVQLSQFRGKTVVLQFMDPRCTDICPILSAEVEKANQDLGDQAKQVVYLAVNVNQYAESTGDIRAFTSAHGLDKLTNWYFATGSTAQLQKVWHDYGITVEPNPDGDVVHSSYVYFIDPKGKEQYIANPSNTTGQISAWGAGIAFYAQRLL